MRRKAFFIVFSALFLLFTLPYSVSALDLTITSPANTTYTTTAIDLNWSANETMNWAAYSLNGAGNITLGGSKWEYQIPPNTTTCFNTWDASYPCSNIYDNNWSSYGQTTDGNYGDFRFNYTKLSDITDVLLDVKWGTGTKENITIPESCMNWSVDVDLQLRSDDTGPPYSYLYCDNGTQQILATGRSGKQIYEVSVWWNITDYSNPQNVSLTANEGSNSVTIYANDSLGNMNSTTIYFTVDTNEIYDVTIINATNSTFTETQPDIEFNVTGTYTDYECHILLNGTQYGYNLTTCNNTNTLIRVNSSLSDNGYYATVNCTNSTHESESDNSLYFEVDTTPPQITIISPINQTYTSINMTMAVSFNEMVSQSSYNLNDIGNITYFSVLSQSSPQTIGSQNTWNDTYTEDKAHDNDWDTYGRTNDVTGTLGSLYPIEYTKLSSANSAQLEIKWGETRENVSIPSDCFNRNPIQLQIVSKTELQGSLYAVYLYCRQNSDDTQVLVDGVTGATINYSRVYDILFWWNTTNNFTSWTNTTFTARQGDNDITVYANDTLGNMNSSTVYFYADSITPDIKNEISNPLTCLEYPGIVRLSWYQEDNLDDLDVYCTIAGTNVTPSTESANSSATCSAIIISAGQFVAEIHVVDYAGNHVTRNFTLDARADCGGTDEPSGGRGGSPITIPPIENITLIPECPENETWDPFYGRCRAKEFENKTPSEKLEEYIFAPRILPVNVTTVEETDTGEIKVTEYSVMLLSAFHILGTALVLGYALNRRRKGKRQNTISKIMLISWPIFMLYSIYMALPLLAWQTLFMSFNLPMWISQLPPVVMPNLNITITIPQLTLIVVILIAAATFSFFEKPKGVLRKVRVRFK